MGNSLPWPEVPVSNKDHTNAAVVIIGAGFSGICTAIDLLQKERIRNFIIIEKGGGFGGTWRDNKFPGSCCDVWSHLYSFSFAQSAEWSRQYPGQEEILDYLITVAHKYELHKYVRFNTAVEEARWNDKSMKWETRVKIAGGKDAEFGATYTITSDFLVSAVGQLSLPKFPSIPGIDTFEGNMMHSARWDWSYPLGGKRVAVIGTGATAAQIIPEVAKVAGHLTVLQRSPGWVMPRHDAPIANWVRQVLRYIRPLLWRYRADCMDVREKFHAAVTNADSDHSKMMRKINAAHMRKQLPERSDLWEKLSPDYKPGCKRSVISDDYYLTFLQPNVTLETRHVEGIAPNGILFTDAATPEEFDMIVCATGFHSLDFLSPVKLYGRNGRSIEDIWKGNARAFKGVSVEDLPNFAMLYGPNSNLTHNSLILVIEAQSRYITCLISEVIKARKHKQSLALIPKPDKVQAYNKDIQEKLRNTSFGDPNCNSWWKNADGVIPNNWHLTAVDYQKMMATVKWSEYDFFGSGKDDVERLPDHYIGRVVEETRISYRTVMMTAAIGLVIVGGYWAKICYAP